MCGICGIYWHDPRADVDRTLIRRMRDTMVHRGPDAAGEYYARGLGFGHRRLRIIDLTEAAAQPMSNPAGTVTIIYNGEIYNFRELRRSLEGRGFRFLSNSDTEVLLHLYEAEGGAMVRRLNGIFAFAIYDAREDMLFCARDPLGVKPFYYTRTPAGFLFASEIKALLAAGVPAEMNSEAVGEYLVYRYTSGERTLFRNIRRLLPGHTVRMRRDSAEPQVECYWSVFDTLGRQATGGDRIEQLRTILRAAVKRQMISDVPVGTMCSGGIDSSGLTALAAEQGEGHLSTFSIIFNEESFSEAGYARQVSAHCGTAHHELVSTPEDFARLLPLTIWFHDEPLMHPNSVPIYQISRLAKACVTVLLSGEGADEVFGGYHWQYRFASMAQWHVWARGLSSLGRIVSRRLSRYRWERLFVALAAHDLAHMMVWSGALATPAQLARVGFQGKLDWPDRLQSARRALSAAEEPAQARLLYDQLYYLAPLLDRQDKMCMGNSIESRVPYLDLEVVSYVNRLPVQEKIENGAGKLALRRALQGYLPSDILERRKFGFGIPADEWLRSEPSLCRFLQALRDNPEQSYCTKLDVLDARGLKRAFGAFLNRQGDLGAIIWPVVSLELWLRIFLGRRNPWEQPPPEIMN